jgi:PPOX class probable F420-dependent enzyme
MPVDDRRRRRTCLDAAMLTGMDGSALATARIERFLETEPVVWLSTIDADGSPHLVPTWFVWDGSEIVIRSKPGAVKVSNLRRDPRAMLALGDAEDDFDIGLLRATARLEPTSGPELPPLFERKYASQIARLGLTPTEFARTYSQVIRLTPVRALGWHGRSRPASVVAAARRLSVTTAVSIAEPLLRAVVELRGEPIARVPAGDRGALPAAAH